MKLACLLAEAVALLMRTDVDVTCFAGMRDGMACKRALAFTLVAVAVVLLAVLGHGLVAVVVF